MLTDFIRYNYSFYRFRKVVWYMSENQGEEAAGKIIRDICDNVYITHSYAYKGLYDSMNAEYNPIENYDMTEHNITNNRGTDTTTLNRDAHNDTKDVSEDAYTDSETLGDTSVTDSWGERKTNRDNEDKIATFESEDYNNLDNSFASETQIAVTDSHTSLAVVNDYDKGRRHNREELDYGKQHEVSGLEHGHEIEYTLTRNGNIGVTTTQQMLEQERRIVRMNLVRIVANDIIQTLCSTLL